jgi:nucleoside 2-deoxyribosyltransferase
MIFISHAHRDREWARNLADHLSDKGLQIWLDEYELQPGERWEEQIKNALIQSDTIVVILNEGKPAPNVLFEMGVALSQGKRILPVVLSEHADTSVLEEFSDIQAIQTKEVGLVAQELVNTNASGH